MFLNRYGRRGWPHCWFNFPKPMAASKGKPGLREPTRNRSGIGTRSFLPFPMSPLAALKVTPFYFPLLFKSKCSKHLTSAVFSMAIGMLHLSNITVFRFKCFLFSHGQLEKENCFGIINKHLPNWIYQRESEGAISHFWKQDRIMGKALV